MRKVLIVFGVIAVIGAISLAGNTDAPPPDSIADSEGTRGYRGPRFLDGTPDSIGLDYRTGDLYIKTSVVAAGTPRPDTVWVWAYFVSPQERPGGSRSDEPIPVATDFSAGDTLTIEARGRFHWWDNSLIDRSLPTYAMITISAHGPDSARVATGMRTEEVRFMKRVNVRR